MPPKFILIPDRKLIAFPGISTGIYRFPEEKAAEIAVSTVSLYLQAHPDNEIREIFFVCFDEESLGCYTSDLENS
ncbi:macro domain-containing protein [Flavihumibacter petaseus]|uniref:macro domain-containing protein n=1 Tax=Flavihumibacter petaseus TaxID=549295 RepID=UPI0034E1BBF6